MHSLVDQDDVPLAKSFISQKTRIAPARRITRDAAAIDAAADDSEVENLVQEALPRRSPIHFGDFAFDFE